MKYTDAILNGSAHGDAAWDTLRPVESESGGGSHGDDVGPRGSDPSSGGAFDWGSALSMNGQPTVGQGTGGAAGSGIPSRTANPPASVLPGAAVQASQATGAGAAPYGSPFVTTNIGGKPLGDKDPILPAAVPAIDPALQKAFMQYMESQVGKGVSAYPGALSPDQSKTILPEVAAAWHPLNIALAQEETMMLKGYPSLNNLMSTGMPTADGVNPMAAFLQGRPLNGYKTPTKVG